MWESSRDGHLGTGEQFSRDDLSVGVHTITLTATNGDGLSDADEVSITVEEGDECPGHEIWC